MKKILYGDGIYSFIAAILSIAVGLLVGLVVLLLSDAAQALPGLGAVLTGGFASMREVGQVLYIATPIILTGLSVGLANQCGLFNIGGAGQFIIGGYAALYIGVHWTFLPGPAHWLAALIGACAAGAVWGLIPGLMKAFMDVNEVISCIMMNYIGMSLANMLTRRTIYNAGINQSLPPAPSAVLPRAGLDMIFRTGNAASGANLGFIIAVLAGIVIHILINHSKTGFELKSVGYNRYAAQYAGINEKKSVVVSMAIAGLLSGLGGALMLLAGSGRSIRVEDILAAEGFNGIPVALLGMNHPIAIIFSGLLISHLTNGGFNMQLYGFVPQIVEIITSVIIYFAACAMFFRGMMKDAVKRVRACRRTDG